MRPTTTTPSSAFKSGKIQIILSNLEAIEFLDLVQEYQNNGLVECEYGCDRDHMEDTIHEDCVPCQVIDNLRSKVRAALNRNMRMSKDTLDA